MSLGSGYCVGIVVESRMAIRGNEREEGNGLEDVWVIGEPFFRDCQVAFDVSLDVGGLEHVLICL